MIQPFISAASRPLRMFSQPHTRPAPSLGDRGQLSHAFQGLAFFDTFAAFCIKPMSTASWSDFGVHHPPVRPIVLEQISLIDTISVDVDPAESD
jgi:hypothetical protein